MSTDERGSFVTSQTQCVRAVERGRDPPGLTVVCPLLPLPETGFSPARLLPR